MSWLGSVTDAGSTPEPIPRRAKTLEIVLVLGLPTIVGLLASIVWLAHPRANATVSDARLLRTIGEEIAFCAVGLPFLRRRGWTPAAAAGQPHPVDVLRAGLVWLTSYVAYVVVAISVISLAPALAPAAQTPPFGVSASAATVLFVSLVNPLFEEFLWLGYGISALRPRLGLTGACVVSIALRVLVHAYQGPMALIGIAPLAIVFTMYYALTGRLWPVIVAHILQDVIGLAAAHR